MIIDLDKYQEFKKENFPDKKVVCTSGYFDPIHPGHISCIRESKKLGDILVVLVNGDNQCVVKKGKAFLPAKERAYIIDSIKDVDYVVVYDNDQTTACTEAMEIIKPDIFAKGGDRNTKGNVPEVDSVEANGGKVVYNIGDPKMWSSSDYLAKWVEFANSKN